MFISYKHLLILSIMGMSIYGSTSIEEVKSKNNRNNPYIISTNRNQNKVGSIAYEETFNTYFYPCISKHKEGSFERELDCHKNEIEKNIINGKAIASCAIRSGTLNIKEENLFVVTYAFSKSRFAKKYPYLKEYIYKRYLQELTSGSQYKYNKISRKRVNYVGGCVQLLRAYYPALLKPDKTRRTNEVVENKESIIKKYHDKIFF